MASSSWLSLNQEFCPPQDRKIKIERMKYKTAHFHISHSYSVGNFLKTIILQNFVISLPPHAEARTVAIGDYPHKSIHRSPHYFLITYYIHKIVEHHAAMVIHSSQTANGLPFVRTLSPQNLPIEKQTNSRSNTNSKYNVLVIAVLTGYVSCDTLHCLAMISSHSRLPVVFPQVARTPCRVDRILNHLSNVPSN